MEYDSSSSTEHKDTEVSPLFNESEQTVVEPGLFGAARNEAPVPVLISEPATRTRTSREKVQIPDLVNKILAETTWAENTLFLQRKVEVERKHGLAIVADSGRPTLFDPSGFALDRRACPLLQRRRE